MSTGEPLTKEEKRAYVIANAKNGMEKLFDRYDVGTKVPFKRTFGKFVTSAVRDFDYYKEHSASYTWEWFEHHVIDTLKK